MGPRLKDVEDGRDCGQCWNWRNSFNGATSQGRGRQVDIRFATTHQIASMGPRLKDVEDMLNDFLYYFRHVASMGPRLKDVEDTVYSLQLRYELTTRFNGATSQGRGRLADSLSCFPGETCFNGATSQGRGRRRRCWL